MSQQSVVLEDCGAYACITLSRSTLDTAAQQQLQDVMRESVGRYPVIILTGTGKSFCEGFGAEAEAGGARSEFSRQGHSITDTVEAIRKHPSVFIAAVNGDAIGDGVSLINVCDLAIAAEDAQIGLPEITKAGYPTIAGPSTQLRVLRKHASWLILTGKRIDGRTAARWGMVTSAVPADRVM